MSRPCDEVTDEQREHCALVNMRMMLTEYAEQNKITFEEAFLQFVNTPVYKMLFDYETRLWAEGPKYLLSFFEASSR